MAEQEDLIVSIERTVENFKKLGQNNFTTAATRNRQFILERQWLRCQQIHAELKATVKLADRPAVPYFAVNQYEDAVEAYFQASDYLSEILEKLMKPVAAVTASSTLDLSQTCSNAIPLPRIDLLKFSGQYTEWANFRDIFESLVIKNESLSNVQRLHYLKSCLTGEARVVVKNITVTDANYEMAWKAVKDRYENMRAIVASYLDRMLDAVPMKSDSVTELKRVHDTVNDALIALRCLDRNEVDDFVVAILTKKLDSHTRTEWELSLGNVREPATFSDLSTFLVGRIVALSASGGSRDSTGPKANRGAATKSLASAVSEIKCPCCSDSHLLFQCTKFKSLSTEQRKEIVRQHHCCYNCFGKGHYPRDCHSRKRCTRCQRKHHTLLHDDGEASAGQVKVLTADARSVDVQQSVSPSTSKTSHSANVSDPSITAPVTENVLLATAQIIVSTPNDRYLSL